MEFNELIETRHSANNFLEDVQITVKDLEHIFEDIKLAPSAFNLQHAEYKVVLDKDLKEKVKEAANGQYKVHSASAVILVTGDRYAYRQTEKINEGMRDLGIIKDFELHEMIENNTHFYESRGEQFMKEEAIRNASLSAMMFMLAAKNRGWDTCPMIGFDSDQVRDLLKIPDTHEIVLMITIGKEKESSRRLRGYRKPVNEFVSFY
ncbi:NAD(P)H nitroreductase [Bacillus glycinifermentans]|uniref:NAD(P)H nitroreductase n=1 Tax=Bacillus glycinifermentans TaxID=1664069 RepID=A0A0J6F0J5_9BACI|nr:nitroreductase family protein [Bacillus glycinifermentans]ATH94183.1 nitroreductase family protein [Bacillus glycinifermentans]KMM62815.1 NAD(P)H nitroreductase [Bacillus glycinifermentans]KRT95606.1 NAD(P)H nitroreductase [Bacillus glycinifermentans]MEC0484515.1 nitroreductase family protein [Bacillus glycinifermentans]MEC0496906.1 nitroreductase family protein [Bacillus glycinifermentans]